MRHIGSLDAESQARSLQAYLVTQKIRCMVEEEDGTWAVWIYEEDQVDQGREELAAFRANPDDARYAAALAEADQIRKEAEKQARKQQKQQVNVREEWERPLTQRARVTMGLILISLIVCALTTQLEGQQQGRGLLGPRLCNKPSIEYLAISARSKELPEVRSGEVWRLVTPIFLHFNMLHIFFNMFWMRDIGAAIEIRRGSLRFVGLVLFCAVVSNVAQNFLGKSGPAFGGMSGVVFGLMGYVYIKSRFQPEAGLYMSQNLAMFGVLWLFLGFTEVIPDMANWAHLFGLLAGGVVAYMPVVFDTRS